MPVGGAAAEGRSEGTGGGGDHGDKHGDGEPDQGGRIRLWKFLANTQARRVEEQNRRADAAIGQALANLRKEPEQMKVDFVYDQSIAEEYRKEHPEEYRQEQKEEMSEQTKMMRFQAAQVEKLLQKMEKLNDTMNMIIRCIRGE